MRNSGLIITLETEEKPEHRKLLDSFKRKAKMSKYGRRLSESRFHSHDSKSRLKSHPHYSISSVQRYSSIPEHDIAQPVVSVGQDVVERGMAISKRAWGSSSPKSASDSSTSVSFTLHTPLNQETDVFDYCDCGTIVECTHNHSKREGTLYRPELLFY